MLLFGVVIPIQNKILAQFGAPTDLRQSLLFASYAAGLLISTPLMGIVSDRWGTRQMPMLFGLAAMVTSILLFAYAGSFGLLLMARFFQGVSAAATWVVGLAMLTDAWVDDGLGFATSFALSFHSVGNVLGPLVGGFMAQYWGLKAPFFFCASLALIDFAARAIIKPARPEKNRKKRPLEMLEAQHSEEPLNSRASFGNISVWALLQNRQVILILLAVILGSSSFSAIENFASTYAMDEYGLNEAQTSLAFLGFILPSMVASLVVGYFSDRFYRYRIITIGMIVHSFALPSSAAYKDFRFFIVGSILYSICSSVLSTPCSPELAHVVDQLGGASFARIYAIYNMFYSVGMILGPVVVGYIKYRTGSLFLGLTFLSAVTILYAPVFFFCYRQCRHSLMESLTHSGIFSSMDSPLVNK